MILLYALLSTLVAAGLLRATLRGRDSFPFSCFPMAASAPETPVVYAVEGLDAEGRVLRFPASAPGEEKTVSRLLAPGMTPEVRERLQARFPAGVRLRVVRREARLSPAGFEVCETVVPEA